MEKKNFFVAPQITNGLGAHQGQENVIVLLALILVHGGHFVRQSHQRIIATTFLQHVADEMLLAVIRGQDGDGLGGVAQQTHVHKGSHHVLRLRQVLQNKRAKLNFNQSIDRSIIHSLTRSINHSLNH